jgi:adenylylsulfate kinase
VKNKNIYPISDRLIAQTEKEKLLGSKGMVFWLYGLSGSGKSTMAVEMEKRLHEKGIHSVVLDGDNLRSGLNEDLSFSENDRRENIRRVSEVAKILSENGIIVFVSLITPLRAFRQSARTIIGDHYFQEVFVKASFNTCQQRDVKGLYAKASEGQVPSFTGQGSDFEEPEDKQFTIDSEKESEDISSEKLFQFVLDSISL